MKPYGRPTVFADRETMQDILADLVKNRTGRIGKWQYLTDMEADTDIPRIQHTQPVMFAIAKFRNDLRISQKELAKACFHVMKNLIRYRGKDLKTFANVQAFMLRVACRHWLRDWQLSHQWP